MIAPEVADEAARVAEALLDARVADADSFEALRRASRWGEMLHAPRAHEPA